MKYLKPFNESKPAGAPEFHDSKAPDAHGRFRDLSIEDLAAWLIKTRKKDVKKISSSLTQQIVFNRNDDPEYAEKMEKTRQEVYKQLGRKDLMDSKQIDNTMKYIKKINEASFGNHSKKDYSDEMSYGQLERCIDYANMIRERIEAGTSLDAWMYSQIAVAENELNAVFGALDGDDGVIERKEKPGPDAYMTGLDDETEKEKKAQMKKQAEMDDDDPDAYKEMPGSKEARVQGKVKTSKHVKNYHELYGDDEANESVKTTSLKRYKELKKKGIAVELVTKADLNDEANENNILEKSKVLKFKEWGIDNHVELKQLTDYLRDEDINWNQKGQSLKFDSVEDADKAKEWLGESFLNEGVMSNSHQMAGDETNGNVFESDRVYIDFLNKDKKFKQDRKYFKSWEEAVKWGRSEFDRFSSDMIKYESFQLDEGTMSDIHQLAGEVKSADEFVKKFFKEYGAKIKKSSDSVEWVKSLYQDTVDESLVNEDEEKKQSTDRTPLEDDAMETGLKKKAEETGVPIGIIRAVARRGLAAWKTGHRPGATQQQWAYARTNSFLTKQPGTWGGADSDLAKEVRDGGYDKKLKKA